MIKEHDKNIIPILHNHWEIERICLTAFILLFSLVSLQSISAQVVYEESNNSVTLFLERISQKGIIEFDNLINPIPRNYIAEKLDELKNNTVRLNTLEKEELEFYLKDYGFELDKLKSAIKEERTDFFKVDRYKRFRIFNYEDNLFSISASPIFGYEYRNEDNSSQTRRWNGLKFHGYIGENIGFNFSFRDNRESGDSLDAQKLFTRETGITIAKRDKNAFEYSDFTGSISYSWDWGTVAIAKQQLTWGYEKSGHIVLSNKAPSFPVIRLDINPADWFSFNYFHGWLNSDVEDTAAFYPSYVEGHSREIHRNKYIASHTVSIKPMSGLTFSLGESIIYSEELQIGYLFPMMFFRATDHFLHYPSNDLGDNSQFFFNISSKNHLPNTHLYGSLYIDEIRTTEIFNSEKQRNQIGFNIGASVTDLPLENLTLEVEYSRINPFAYVHYIPTLTYQSDSYNLGHWIGHNGDLLYLSAYYRAIRGLNIKLWLQSIRKGEEGTPFQQWDVTVPQPEFLFGLNTKYNYYGIDVQYEFIHDLFFRAKYQYSSIETEIDEGVFDNQNFSSFNFALFYGI